MENLSNNGALTPTEKAIVYYMAKGYTNQEIANTLNIPFQKVKGRASMIFTKLHAKNRANAVAIAFREL